MATYTETIDIKVPTDDAEKASRQIKVLGAAMVSVNDRMIKADAVGGVMSRRYLLLAKEASVLQTALDSVDRSSIALVDSHKASVIASKPVIASLVNTSNVLSVAQSSAASFASGVKSAFSSLASGDVVGVIHGISDSLAGMAKALDLLVPGLGEAVSVAITVASGFAGVAAGIVKSGVAMSISATQSKQAMLTMFDALGAGVMTGEEVDGMLDGLSQRLGQTKDAMVPLINKFTAIGVTSREALEKMTEAALSAKALAGGSDDAISSFETLSTKIALASEAGIGLAIPVRNLLALSKMGLSVTDVAEKMGVSAKDLSAQLSAGTANAKKFGDALQDALISKGSNALHTMGMSMKNLRGLFDQYIGDMFEDQKDDVDKLSSSVKDFFSIFDSKAQPSGEALKMGIGLFFHEALTSLDELVPVFQDFLENVVIWSLDAAIALRDFSKTMEFKIIIGTVEALGASLLALTAVVGLFAGAILLVAAILTAIPVVMLALIGAVGYGLYKLVEILSEWSLKGYQASNNFVAGLVKGMTDGIPGLSSVAKLLGMASVDAVKDAHQTRSPSRVAMKLGSYFGKGLAIGTRSTEVEVYGAASSLATSAVSGIAGSGRSSPQDRSPSSIVVHVQVDGAGKSALEITEEMVSLVFERLAMSAGV